MKDQITAALGAIVGATFLIFFGVLGPELWTLYVFVALSLTIPSRTRPVSIGLWSAFLAAASFLAAWLPLA